MADKILQFKGTIYEEGYGLVAKKVMKDKGISVGARCLYAYLCTFASNLTKSVFPGRNTICFDLKISKDTFSKYKKELEQKGYLTVIQIKNDNKFSHNVYNIESVPCPKISDTRLSDTKSSDTKNLDINNTIINNTIINNTSSKYSDDFLEWYSLYPNPFNKQQSFKNFKRILKEDTFENIMLATKNYMAYLKHRGTTDKQYIVRSTNFIGNKKEYLGYLEMDLNDNSKGNSGLKAIEEWGD